MMQKSILIRLIVVLSLILIISSGGSIYFAGRGVRKIVEENQVRLFKEKIDTLVKSLDIRAQKLNETAHPEAYREDFERAAIKMINAGYIDSKKIAPASYPVVINRNEKIIVHPFLGNSEKLIRAESFLKKAERYTSSGGHVILQDEVMWGVFLPFNAWQWTLGFVMPIKELYKSSDRLQSHLFWAMVFGTFSAIVVISLAVYRIVKPLGNLRIVADSLASGDYTIPFDNVFNTRDEIGSLAGSLERMRKVIQDRLHELQDTNVTLRDEIKAREEADAARLRQERDYQEIFNATSEAIIIFKVENGEILRVNNTMLRLYGYDSQEVMGLRIETLFPELSVPGSGNIEEMIARTRSESHIVFEWRSLTRDGLNLWVEVSLRSSTIGGEYCLLAVLRDISERKLAEREKARMEEQLRHVQRMEAVGTLAGGIAHDFNNILTPLIGYAEMLLMQLDQSTKQYREAEAIYSASLRARDLVQQILAISRKGDMIFQPVEVYKEVEEAVNLVRASLPKQIAVICDIDHDCAPVMAEPGQIHQIVMNLSTNGYHAMKDTTGTLSVFLNEIRVETSSLTEDVSLKPGNYIRLIISDTGRGIPPEEKKKIFDPYYTTKETGEGTGLGLSIVHGIVKSLNGYITVASQTGNTVFTTYIPCVADASWSHDRLKTQELVPGKESIMLVDDERYILDLECSILEHLGYKVHIFEDSMKAFASFSATPDAFDLVVTDMTMPIMSGFELSRRLKEVKPDIPILLISGYSDIINKDQAGQVGIHAILTKPIDMANFSRTLRQALKANGQ